MQEILPGLYHWTARHPGIGAEVSSYYWAAPKVLLDPLLPSQGLEWLRQQGPPEAILLTNRHHDRDSQQIVDAFGCAVRCPAAGLHELADKALQPTGYAPGDTLPGGVEAIEVGVLCPDESALLLPVGEGALAVADGVVDMGGGLGFVPDGLLGDDPAAIKRGLKEAYARIADGFAFDTLLLAHGPPIVTGGREALRAFAAS